MLYLSKLLPVFVYPLGAAILLGAVALALLFVGYLRTARWLLAAILIALWVVSTPLFANWITVRLEGTHPPQAIEALPAADAVILLGGVLDRPASGGIPADLGEAADRLLHAARLYRAGKAPRIIVTGGNLPWIGGAPESETLAELLVELGLPRPALIVEPKSVNTRESGVNVAAIFREQSWRTGLLVTSGTHMPRALAVFHAAGVDVAPAATDIHGRPRYRVSLLACLPDAAALTRSTSAFKEFIGLYAYRWLGWA
jgi:uncharacterized SAM-binding protein YcdF (DUF218 family)